MDIYEEVSAFYRAYSGEKCIYGFSEEGRDLYAMYTGRGHGVGICQYGIHGREWITSLLALEQIKYGTCGGVWFLPLTNPDGALLSEIGLASVSDPNMRTRLRAINGTDDFSLWKANANAVDLNVNFDANWGMGASNLTVPASQNYIGASPFSERESLALKQFTEAVQPCFTVSYHTKGEEIYWNFHQPPLRAMRDKRYVMRLSASTGYPIRKLSASCGGYKDWCVQKLKIPAFTVEAGSDLLPHPIGREHLDEICSRNIKAVADLSDFISKKEHRYG